MTKTSPLKIRFTAGLAPSGLLRAREGISTTAINNVTHAPGSNYNTAPLQSNHKHCTHSKYNSCRCTPQTPKPLGLRQAEHPWRLKADCLTWSIGGRVVKTNKTNKTNKINDGSAEQLCSVLS